VGIDQRPGPPRAPRDGDSAAPREDWRTPFRAAPLSLPTGGAAIRGIGEKPAAHLLTGSGTFSIPLPLWPGRSGVGPQPSLSYDSGAGNGPVQVRLDR